MNRFLPLPLFAALSLSMLGCTSGDKFSMGGVPGWIADGGKLAGQILAAMEIMLNSKPGAYSRYGSSTHKQVYIYGRLSLEPTILGAAYGMAWGVGGFLLTPFLQKVGNEEAGKLRARVAAELKTTVASHYTRTISLRDALDRGGQAGGLPPPGPWLPPLPLPRPHAPLAREPDGL
jgi:hypothetical protein